MLLLPYVILQVFHAVQGYPNGAPTGACEDMLPRHVGVLPQPSPAPYSLLTNSRTFEAGKPITGKIILFYLCFVMSNLRIFDKVS